jgi:hypothetical protein
MVRIGPGRSGDSGSIDDSADDAGETEPAARRSDSRLGTGEVGAFVLLATVSLGAFCARLASMLSLYKTYAISASATATDATLARIAWRRRRVAPTDRGTATGEGTSIGSLCSTAMSFGIS